MRFLLILAACSGGPPSPNVFDADADGVLSFIDCDDGNAGVYPGAKETFYDGRDADCLGDSDYDQDGDGYDWVAHGGEDCDDTDPSVNPAGTEVVYDGADNDCDPTTLDDDLDGDGSRFVDDCDDEDPESYPGAVELLADGVDQDCRGDGDSSILGRWDRPLTRPHHLRATGFEGRPVFAFAAERVDPQDPDVYTYDPGPGTTAPALVQVVMALVDPLSAEVEELVAFGADHEDVLTADEPTAVDVLGDDDTLWFGIAFNTWRNADLRTRLSPYLRFNDGLVRQNGPSRTLDGFTGQVVHTDLQLRTDGVQLSGGGTDSLTLIQGARGDVDEGLGGVASSNALGGSAIAPDGLLWACDDAESCASWTVPVDGPPADPEALPGVTRILRERDGLLLILGEGRGADVIGLQPPLRVFADETVLDADVVLVERADGSDWIVAAAVVQDGSSNAVALAFGPADAGLLTTAFYEGPDNGQPQEVAIWADAEEVVVGVLTQDFGDPDRLWRAAFPWAP